MDLTQGSPEEKNARSKKMMLWFGIVSLLMGFAAFTSAYIVSSKRDDWLEDLDLPSSFFISTAVIVVSSLTYILAKRAMRGGNAQACFAWLLTTLGLGIAFIVLQFNGFGQMIGNDYYFTGPTSNVKISYIFLIAVVHIAHVVAGIISLLVVVYNQWRGKYTPTSMLGLELGATFWHFLDLLWVYLILFMAFVK